MEICVRYCAYFDCHAHFIPQVLENFVRFVHHDHIRVRTRSWYLFHRFVKHVRAHIGNLAQTVIEAISDLLLIKAELPGESSTEDDMSSDESDHSTDAVFNSQLFLFEAVGCISSTPTIPVERQLLYARSITDPLILDMENQLEHAKSKDERAVLQIHHDIMAIGTLARGFSEWTPGSTSSQSHAPAKAVSDEFSRVAEAIIVSLESLK